MKTAVPKHSSMFKVRRTYYCENILCSLWNCIPQHMAKKNVIAWFNIKRKQKYQPCQFSYANVTCNYSGTNDLISNTAHSLASNGAWANTFWRQYFKNESKPNERRGRGIWEKIISLNMWEHDPSLMVYFSVFLFFHSSIHPLGFSLYSHSTGERINKWSVTVMYIVCLSHMFYHGQTCSWYKAHPK